jgi:hypothetical protein
MAKVDVQQDPHYKRLVFTTTGLSLAVLVLLRVFVFPVGSSVEQLTARLLESGIVGLLSGLLTSVIVLWLHPGARELPEISIIKAGSRLKETLREDLKGSREFWYRGHTGKWTRTVTLPGLMAQAREEKVGKSVYMVILDPDNRSACELLAKLDTRRDASIDIEERVLFIRRQLMATILAALFCEKEEPRVSVRIGLHGHFSLFRVDLTVHSVVVTRANPDEPAIRYSRSSDFYKSYRDEVEANYTQSRKLELDAWQKALLSKTNREKLTEAEVRTLLEGLGITVRPEDSMSEVIRELSSERKPY